MSGPKNGCLIQILLYLELLESYKDGYVGRLNLHWLPLLNHLLIVTLCLFIGIALAGTHLNWLSWFHVLIFKGDILVILRDSMIFLSSLLDITWMSMSTVFHLAQLDF